jgi:DNA (cytosine-5)-methyltransferase 1
LFFENARILEAKRPRAFLLENVKNLASHDRGNTLRVICRTLADELGYEVFHQVIDAAAVVPQHRERIYIVGFRDPVHFAFPHLARSRPRLSDLLEPRPDPGYTLTPALWEYLQAYAARHEAAGHGFGFGLVDPSDPEATTRTLSARYYKDGSEILIARPDDRPRKLTPRECARLMGFPDTFAIPVSNMRAYRQFGNSVVVPVVEQVARALIRALEGDLPEMDTAGHQPRLVKAFASRVARP